MGLNNSKDPILDILSKHQYRCLKNRYNVLTVPTTELQRQDKWWKALVKIKLTLTTKVFFQRTWAIELDETQVQYYSHCSNCSRLKKIVKFSMFWALDLGNNWMMNLNIVSWVGERFWITEMTTKLNWGGLARLQVKLAGQYSLIFNLKNQLNRFGVWTNNKGLRNFFH